MLKKIWHLSFTNNYSNINLCWWSYFKYLRTILVSKNTFMLNPQVQPLFKKFMKTKGALSPMSYVNNRAFLSSEKPKELFPLFTSFIQLSLSHKSHHFFIHKNYKLLNLVSTAQGPTILNTQSYYHRWADSYSFLTNIVYFDLIDLIFGSSYFKAELSAFNWLLFKSKNSLQTFTTSNVKNFDTSYGYLASLAFKKLQLVGNNTALLLNLWGFSKTLHHLKRSNVFVFALVSTYENPWTVHYPIPVVSTNYVTQLFFIKLLLMIKQKTLTLKFNRYLSFVKR